MANITDVADVTTPAPPEGDGAPRPQEPRPQKPRRDLNLRKWRARFAVLVMIAVAVLAGSKVAQARNVAAAHLGLGTVTLTAQAIPVESVTPGRVTAAAVHAQQRVSAGQRLGTLLTTTTTPSGAPTQKTVVLTAPADGIVISDPTPVGTALQSGQPFVEIYDPAQLTFLATVSAKDLTRLSHGMVATLKPEGLGGPVPAVVDRAVPQVIQAGQVGQPGAGSAPLQLVLVPKNVRDVAQFVPGLHFTGSVDTGTASGPSLTGLPVTR